MAQVSSSSLNSQPVLRPPFSVRFQIYVQWLLNRIAFFPFCAPLLLIQRYVLGIHVADPKRHRKFYRELMQERTPLVICSNHLTYIDSVVLIQAFAGNWRYIFQGRYLSWNLPASNYRSNPFFYLVGILSKCIFINRTGKRDDKERVLIGARWIVSKGEPLTIFPEGRRSTTGRFDEGRLAFGVGKILRNLPECRVLCVYSRADGQIAKSKFPKLGARFRISYELLRYNSEQLKPLTAVSAVTHQIADTIKRLEAAHFNELQGSDANPPALSP